MAMTVTLRTTNGEDITTVDIGPLPAYPDIIDYDGDSYILKRVMPDKRSALYYKATILPVAKLAKPGEI